VELVGVKVEPLGGAVAAASPEGTKVEFGVGLNVGVLGLVGVEVEPLG
jgi:hypothetical protein